MNAGLVDQIVRGEAHAEPITTYMYHEMLEHGVLFEGSPIELIDGYLFRKNRRDCTPEERAAANHSNSSMLTDAHVLHNVASGVIETEPITVDMYHQMIEFDVIADGSPVELIGGLLVRKDQRDQEGDPMGQGSTHMSVVTEIHLELNALVRPLDFHGRAQGPITLGNDHEPEPDIAIVRGKPRDYERQHPEADNIALVVEVSATSLSFDRGTKAELYASSGIRAYWIVNLNDRCLEVHTQPDVESAGYLTRQVFEPGQTVTFDVDGQTLELDVNAILPA